MLSVVLSVAVLSCGNYGYPEGYRGDEPIFTNKPIVGAGVPFALQTNWSFQNALTIRRPCGSRSRACGCSPRRCTYGSFRCGNRRLGEELWLMRCFHRDDRDRMLKFRFGA
jgi:hypothetical protein